MESDKVRSVDQKQRFLKNPLIVLLGSVTLFMIVQILGVVLWLPLIRTIENRNLQLLIISGGNLVTLFPALFIVKNYAVASWRSIGLTWPRKKAFIETLPALIIYFAFSLTVTALAIKFLPGFDADQAQDIGIDKLTNSFDMMMAFMTLVVFVPIFEEVIFRGVLFKGLRHRLPFWFSAVLTSLIFATAHGQLNVAIDTFALSVLLCFLVERHRSIVPAIMLHSLKNGVAFSLLFIFK